MSISNNHYPIQLIPTTKFIRGGNHETYTCFQLSLGGQHSRIYDLYICPSNISLDLFLLLVIPYSCTQLNFTITVNKIFHVTSRICSQFSMKSHFLDNFFQHLRVFNQLISNSKKRKKSVSNLTRFCPSNQLIECFYYLIYEL